jgi:DNA-binding beta-propeller fold protein YncE
VAVDAWFYVYVADFGNHRIQKFDGSGRFVTAWGRAGNADGEFNSNRGPAGIAVDHAGRVYVADEGSHRIQRFDRSGAFVAKWGTYGQRNGEFYSPMGVAVDNAGHVYVADTDNNRIQKFEALVPMEGTVLRDQQGIVAAPVVLRNQATGMTARTQTDRAGNYRFDSVGAASPYEIQIDDLLLKEAASLCGRLNFWGVPSTDISVALGSKNERTKVMKTRTDKTGSFCFQNVGGLETYRITFDRVTVR